MQHRPHHHPLVLLTLLCTFALGHPAHAVDAVNKTFFGGVAIEGYDPVAYFTEGKPVKGSKQHTFDWRGAQWRFSSAAHRDAFAADPERYAPQYGGYCAFAVAHGDTASIDPDAWTIVDGRLYLNYSPAVQQEWEADRDAFIEQADAAWPELQAD